MKRQRFTIAAALLLLAAVSASCGNEAAETQDETPSSRNAAETVTEAAPTEKIYSEQLTFTDYGGEEFRIYTSNNINGLTYPTTLNHGEEETGEVVNDALSGSNQNVQLLGVDENGENMIVSRYSFSECDYGVK